jgi:hypothetical protein
VITKAFPTLTLSGRLSPKWIICTIAAYTEKLLGEGGEGGMWDVLPGSFGAANQ